MNSRSWCPEALRAPLTRQQQFTPTIRDLFPDSFRVMGQVAAYFEPAAIIVVLVLLGQVLEWQGQPGLEAELSHWMAWLSDLP